MLSGLKNSVVSRPPPLVCRPPRGAFQLPICISPHLGQAPVLTLQHKMDSPRHGAPHENTLLAGKCVETLVTEELRSKRQLRKLRRQEMRKLKNKEKKKMERQREKERKLAEKKELEKYDLLERRNISHL